MESPEIKLGKRIINYQSPAYVIAEIGHNHQGSVDLCEKIIEAAAAAGADCVKLQKRDNKTQFTHAAYNAIYNSENSFGRTYGDHREFLEFNKEQFLRVKSKAEACGLDFCSTAFDIPSVDFLLDIGVSHIKIASGDLVNTPLLTYASATGIPLIVSTGASTLEDVDRAVEVLSRGASQFALLQCTSGYPANHEELSIAVIQTYAKRYSETIVGFSSHENGIAMPLVAYALGARIIEKHFTTDRTMKGTDQALSLSPSGMRRMCRDLKNAHVAMGDGEKRVYPSEIKNIQKQRKSIVAARAIKAGDRICESMLALKVPSNGLPPYRIAEIIGAVAIENIAEDECIKLSSLSFKKDEPNGPE